MHAHRHDRYRVQHEGTPARRSDLDNGSSNQAPLETQQYRGIQPALRPRAPSPRNRERLDSAVLFCAAIPRYATNAASLRRSPTGPLEVTQGETVMLRPIVSSNPTQPHATGQLAIAVISATVQSNPMRLEKLSL
jgi:hypothetical protein